MPVYAAIGAYISFYLFMCHETITSHLPTLNSGRSLHQLHVITLENARSYSAEHVGALLLAYNAPGGAWISRKANLC